MNPEVEDLFDAARRLKPEAQGAFLDAACRGNTDLRRELDQLLAQRPEAEEFLDQGVLGFHPEAAQLRQVPSAFITFATSQEKVGDRVGRFKLREKISEGGCGVVYVADQEEPVRRRVALKVIKVGMDTKSVIARFEAERQALAIMDHQNIAKVFEAGATETGRPYFVMELVRGIKITDFCDQNKLTTTERLEILIKVCQAVQHAHQKGIIHRDLKPSNILVTLNDGIAVPKIIDFGIAKATEGRLTDLTVYTELNQLIGTPAYMSPEQALMTSVDIDTRSDIYSLGVLLYELLTGKPPFENKELLTLGLDEMRRTIREKEPLRPSTRLSTMPHAELDTAAKARAIEPLRLRALLRGDLDWITIKCLEKDRARRYDTAAGLAMDLGRYLSGEPVLACPPSGWYRFTKLVRRHKLLLGALSGIGLVLVAGVITSGIEAWRARRALERAKHYAYAADMNRVQQAWGEGDLELAQMLLRAHVPNPGQADLRGFEWRYLWNLCQDESKWAFTNFEDEVSAAVLASDGKTIAAVSGHKIKLLGISTRRELGELTDPACWITCAAFAPGNTNVLATAGSDESAVKLWNLEEHRLSDSLDAQQGSPRAVAFSPDGKTLAACCGTNLILWNLERRTPVWKNSAPFALRAIAFSPDGKALVSGGQAATLTVWDAITGTRQGELPAAHTGVIGGLAFAPDGKTLASCAADGRLMLWDFAERRLRAKLAAGKTGGVVAFSSDGRHLAAALDGPAIRVWDVATGQSLALLHGHRGGVQAIMFTADGRGLISASSDQTVRLWDLERVDGSRVLKGHDSAAMCVDFSPDTRWVASSCFLAPFSSKVWDVASGQLVAELPGHSDHVGRVVFSPDGRFVASGSWDQTTRLWDVPSWRLIHIFTNGFTAGSLAFSPDSRILAVGGLMGNGYEQPEFKNEKRLTFWDLRSRQKLELLPAAARGAAAVAFNADGRLFATTHFDGSVRLWNLKSGRRLWEAAKEHRNVVRGLAFSRDSSLLVSGGDDGKIALYEVGTGRVLHRLVAHSGQVYCVAFAPGGHTLISSGDDAIKLWTLPELNLALTLKQHSGLVACVTFNQDDTLMASCGVDADVRIWPAPFPSRAR